MPGFDGTGPMGLGPRTGRGRGYCPPYACYQPSYPPQGYYGVGRGGYPRGGGRGACWGGGRGAQWGGGRGRQGRWGGWRDFVPPPPSYPVGEMQKEDEIGYLMNVKADMEEQLKDIASRLNDLQNSPPDEHKEK